MFLISSPLSKSVPPPSVLPPWVIHSPSWRMDIIAWWQFIKTLSISESCPGRTEHSLCPDRNRIPLGSVQGNSEGLFQILSVLWGQLESPWQAYWPRGSPAQYQPLRGLKHSELVLLTCTVGVSKGTLPGIPPAHRRVSQPFPGNQTWDRGTVNLQGDKIATISWIYLTMESVLYNLIGSECFPSGWLLEAKNWPWLAGRSMFFKASCPWWIKWVKIW